MDPSASLKELREEDLDAVSAGCRVFPFGLLGKLHFGKPQFGNNVVQTNIAVQIGVAIGGNVVQVINQSNISDPLLSMM
jgi:starvation-inducible outer membrane lipoprotein